MALNDTPGDTEVARLRRLDLTAATTLVICGGVGLLGAFQLTLEKLRVLADPSYKPACDLNPILSCGAVINTPQSEVLGFPNTILGLAGFSVAITLGILIAARVTLPRWIWLGLNAGAGAGLVFIHWLIAQSLYVIGSLCPWCLAIWIATLPVFTTLTATNLANGRLGVTGPVVDAVVQLRWLILAAWYLTVAALIFLRWQDYWLGSINL